MDEYAVIQPAPLPALSFPVESAIMAIRNPTNARSLYDLSCEKAQSNVLAAVIVDDITRGTPVRLLLPLLLKELAAAGFHDDQVKIVVALGSHRPMSQSELELRLGEQILSRYQVVNQPAEELSAFHYAGESAEGIPAWINRAVWEAGLRIGLGTVTPHMDAGFSGGAKIILPGVCAMPTVDAFHVRMAWHPENYLGNLESPLRVDLESFAAQHCPLHFILNVVTNLEGGLVGCFAGDSITAHRQAAESARSVYGVKFSHRYPIVLADCKPYDQDIWQMSKGLWCGDAVTQDGGILILSGRFQEGFLRYPYLPEYLGREPDEIFHQIQTGCALDPKSAATGMVVGMMKKRIRIAIASPGISGDDADTMGFAYFSDAQSAVQAALEQLPEEQRSGAVAYLPRAGVTLPHFNV